MTTHIERASAHADTLAHTLANTLPAQQGSVRTVPVGHNVAAAALPGKLAPAMNTLLKPTVFILLSLPFLWLVYALFVGELGANPIEAITDYTGEWALRILLLTLALTPLRMVLRKPWPIRLRRMVGLFAFFYALTHLLTYLLLDQQLDGRAILADIIERPYITAGSVGFLILFALAITSTKGMMKRMGKRWLSLHKLVYVGTGAALLHFVWLTRGDQIEPLIYLAVFCVLMLFRMKKLAKRITATS